MSDILPMPMGKHSGFLIHDIDSWSVFGMWIWRSAMPGPMLWHGYPATAYGEYHAGIEDIMSGDW